MTTYAAQAAHIMDTHNRAASYGVAQTNPLSEADLRARDAIDYARPVGLGHADLVKITRLRLLTDAGYPWWDVSYCYGELRDGTPVLVNLPDMQLRKGRGGYRAHLVEMCKAVGKYGKALGLFDSGTISTMR
jgi:hypothetical protein